MSTATDGSVLRLPELRRIDALIGDLIATIDEENRLLASGLPASLAATTGAKARLAAEIETVLRDEHERLSGRLDASARDYLAARMELVRNKAEENAARLVGAMRASRQRIAAIVEAVREERSAALPVYGAAGRRGHMAATAGSLTSGRLI